MRLFPVFKPIALLMILAVMAALTGETALAQNFADPVWSAAYWDNRHLAGTPEVIRNESSINYNWFDSSPFPGEIDKDDFSARWTGTMHFNPGTYRFAVTADDGIRVWVNGDLIIDAWYDHPVQTFTGNKNLSAAAEVYLSGQPTMIRMEYFEYTGGAMAGLSWSEIEPGYQTDWRPAIPPQYHAEFQACLNYLNRAGLELGPSPNWSFLLEQCRAVAGVPP